MGNSSHFRFDDDNKTFTYYSLILGYSVVNREKHLGYIYIHIYILISPVNMCPIRKYWRQSALFYSHVELLLSWCMLETRRLVWQANSPNRLRYKKGKLMRNGFVFVRLCLSNRWDNPNYYTAMNLDLLLGSRFLLNLLAFIQMCPFSNRKVA